MDTAILKDISILYAFIFLGFLIGFLLGERRDKTRTITTKILINIISPLQIFTTLTTNSTQFSFWFVFQIILVMFCCFMVNSITVLLYLKNKEWVTDPQRGTHFLNAGFPNVLFFTLPLILTLFSEELTVVAVFYAVSALVLRGSVGTMICQRFGHGKQEGQTKKKIIFSILKSLFTFPPFLAIIAAMFVLTQGNTSIGEALLPAKPYVNGFASYVSLILVGMVLASLKIHEVKAYWNHIRTSTIWRILIPFVVYMAIVFFLDFGEYDTEVKRILLIIVCGPPAVFNVIFSIYFDLDDKFAAMAVASITLIVLIILPFNIFLGEVLFG